MEEYERGPAAAFSAFCLKKLSSDAYGLDRTFLVNFDYLKKCQFMIFKRKKGSLWRFKCI